MSLDVAHKSRKFIADVTLTNADGTTLTPGANDVVRVKIGRRGDTPLLDLDSAAASANGSVVTKNYDNVGTNKLEIEAADLTLAPGVYTMEVSLVDNADGQAIKHAENHVFTVQKTMTGDVGIS